MRTKPTNSKATKMVKDIRRANRKLYSAEEKIRIVLEGLRGETTIAELCRQEGIAQSMYYKWSKEFLEAGKQRLAGDTARAATTDEVSNEFTQYGSSKTKEFVMAQTKAQNCACEIRNPSGKCCLVDFPKGRLCLRVSLKVRFLD